MNFKLTIYSHIGSIITNIIYYLINLYMYKNTLIYQNMTEIN